LHGNVATHCRHRKMNAHTQPPRAQPEPPPPQAQERLQISIRIGRSLRSVALKETEQWLIGRSSGCAVRIEDPAVSRRHAQLYPRADRVEVEDLGSSNGTWLVRSGIGAAPHTNERRLVAYERTRLRVGDTLRVGDALIELSWLLPSDPRRARRDSSAPPSPVLVDPAMQGVYDLVTRAARRDLSVLVLGETGVGKKLIAQTIHRGSPRAEGPFLILNCAAVPESLLESELFGHEEDAFAGAHSAQPGLLEECDGGTVFLDEIGELPLGMQPKLLRVLEERTVLRLGSSKPRSIDVRFITATHRDLLAEVRAGQFRGDLYHRLSGLSVRVPPLRERPSEIEPLARHFVQHFAREAGVPAPVLDERAVLALQKHFWPGNVRELRSVIERALQVADGGIIGNEHVLLDPGAPTERPAHDWDEPTRVQELTEQTLRGSSPLDERARVVAALETCAGNQRRAAELLGISRRTLVNRLNKWKLPRPKKPPSMHE
jgi:two-component system, NtrC family, response regulator AtoC